jgi:hypothetical protein
LFFQIGSISQPKGGIDMVIDDFFCVTLSATNVFDHASDGQRRRGEGRGGDGRGWERREGKGSVGEGRGEEGRGWEWREREGKRGRGVELRGGRAEEGR